MEVRLQIDELLYLNEKYYPVQQILDFISRQDCTYRDCKPHSFNRSSNTITIKYKEKDSKEILLETFDLDKVIPDFYK